MTVITKAQADNCRTHYSACDCREYRAQGIELRMAYREKVKELER